jgi:hypothetical protein
MHRASQPIYSGLKSVQSLKTFKLLPSEAAPVYHSASILPPFLVNNLRSEHRVVKEFQGEDAVIRAFYFNLMKLAFELENEEKNYVQIVKNILLS